MSDKHLYDIIAEKYDILNGGVDYSAIADFYMKGAARFGRLPRLVLDLCCGTGSVSLELSRRGVDMIGVDISPEMLNVAKRRFEETGKEILLLRQDMREFELYGTVDGIVCCLDSVNHLLSRKDLLKVFCLVRNYLEYGGIFFFDVNSEYKYENVYGFNSYILEDEGLYCGWQNEYYADSGRAYFNLTLFEKGKDGRYARKDVVQKEKYFSVRTIKNALKEAGLELLGIYGDTDFSDPRDDTERLFFFARRPNPEKETK